MRAAVVSVAIWVVAGGFAPSQGQAPPTQQTPQAPTQTPTFKSRIDVIRTDVAVIDIKTGRVVTGLTERDFTVSENGVLQTISTFAAESGADPRPPAPGGDAMPPPRRRVFLFVFGGTQGRSEFERLEGPVNAYDGVARFLRSRLAANDLAAVLVRDRVTALTTDHEMLAQLVERLKQPPASVLTAMFDAYKVSRVGMSPEVRAAFATVDNWLRPSGAPLDFLRSATSFLISAPQYRQNREIGQWTSRIMLYDILKVAAAAEYLRRVDGQKRIVLLNNFGIRFPGKFVNEGVGIRLTSVEDERRFAAYLNDAHVTLDLIQTSGTWRVPNGRNLSSEVVAQENGGTFTSLRTADDQLDQIDEAARTGYVIGYVPANPNLDGTYRNVRIDVNRKNVTVVYRRGYTARPDPPAVDARALLTNWRLRDAAMSDIPLEDIKVKLIVPSSSDPRRCQVELSIDPSALSLTETNGTWEGAIVLMILCADSRGTVVGKIDQEMRLAMSPERLEQAKAKGIPYTATVPVTGPVKYVKAIVYDFEADRLGSAVAVR